MVRSEPAERPRVRTALQINMHPLDVRHVMLTLDHQLRVWGRQVERISITLDTQRSRSGRYRGADYEGSRDRLVTYLAARQAEHRHLEVVEVDYSPETRERVRRAYFKAETAVPPKAFDGGPFHAYFYGLMAANADYVVHMDSDMLFGGASQTWLAEAIDWLRHEPDALFVGPLPGPPRADGSLKDSHRALAGVSGIRAPERLAADYPAYRFSSVSTRIFVLAQRRLDARVRLARPRCAECATEAACASLWRIRRDGAGRRGADRGAGAAQAEPHRFSGRRRWSLFTASGLSLGNLLS